MEYKNIITVGTREVVLGLKLAGVSDGIICDGRKAVDTVLDLMRTKKHSMIIAEEEIIKYAKRQEIISMNTSIDPLVILIPAYGQDIKEPIEILAKRTLGIDIRKFNQTQDKNKHSARESA